MRVGAASQAQTGEQGRSARAVVWLIDFRGRRFQEAQGAEPVAQAVDGGAQEEVEEVAALAEDAAQGAGK